MRKTIEHPGSAGDVPQNTAVKAATRGISFSAPTAVAAITFHLIDEGLAMGVDPESARRALARLSRSAAVVAEISRSFWGEMNNSERLAWLLASTETTYDVRRDGLAVLGVRGR
jgi:hypothetical protein